MSDLIITKRYDKFDGRIITDESILIGDEEKPIKAQWDTGATYCVISSEFVRKFGLVSNKQQEVKSTFSSELKDVYSLDLILNHHTLVKINATESDYINTTGIDLIIGMEVIYRGDFVISTYNGTTCFSFRIPSRGEIDFNKK